jgi:predicted aspartyl protease
MKPIKLNIVALEEKSFHVFLTMGIENIKCRFLLDTGASQTVIDRDYAIEKFGKRKVKTIQKETAGLHSVINETSMITIKKLSIGEHQIKNHLFAAVDLSHVNNTYKKLKKPKIHGILGSDILLEIKAVIDYGKGTLSIHNAN